MALYSNGVEVAGSGTVRGSASNLSNIPAPTNSQILSGVASASVGVVGSYAYVYMNSTKSPGDTFSGNNDDFKYGARDLTKLPSGTWRVMGQTSSSTNSHRHTICLRIS